MAITDANGDAISPTGGWRILSNSTATKTINLGTAPDSGVVWTITDTVGDAGSNNITINATGGQTIGGSASLTISTNNGRVSLKSNGSGWTVLSNSVDANTGGGGTPSGFNVQAQKTSAYTASASDLVLVNLVSAGADITVTLPAASADAEVIVKIAGAANGYVVTVDGNGSETIDGSTTRTMDSDNEIMHVVSDGSNWWRIA
tara:strand:- start:246 stop:854 length:609 start_codon:yes stop_codon:yes gene_type:complete